MNLRKVQYRFINTFYYNVNILFNSISKYSIKYINIYQCFYSKNKLFIK